MMKVLIISNDREYIKRAKKNYVDADVVFSTESAEIIVRKNRYDFIVSNMLGKKYRSKRYRRV